MARREQDVTISAEGRDQGKVFHVREMSASQAERWAFRAIKALMQSGAEVSAQLVAPGEDEEGAQRNATMARLTRVTLAAWAGVPQQEADELMAEMMACVTFYPDPNRREIVRGVQEDDIEEVATRLFLRGATMALHVDFLKLVDRLGLGRLGTTGESQDTKMSPERSPSSSEVASPPFMN